MEPYKIKSADYISSAVYESQYPKGGLLEIAFIGRSNVGKSSMINALTGRKAIAKISSTPGKTKTINFFLINERFFFVDLPGYGYAKVTREEKAAWKKMIEDYLSNRKVLKGVVLIIDLRHGAKESDIEMYNWFKFYNIDIIIAATKADKLSKNILMEKMADIKNGLGTADTIYLFSSKTKVGKNELWDAIISKVKR